MIRINDILITQKGDYISGLYFSRKKSGELTSILKEAYKQLEAYLRGDLKTFDLPLYLEGTEFQKRVWREIQRIPYGSTVTYKDIGLSIDSKAYRAIGSACGKNKIPIIIPCHRVVSCSGIGGFGCGLHVKKELMNIEKIEY